MEDDEIVVEPDVGQVELPEVIETTGQDYGEILTAIHDNQLAQQDFVGGALAVIIFALAMVFGAKCVRGLFDWK